jgi:hypothetical protein
LGKEVSLEAKYLHQNRGVLMPLTRHETFHVFEDAARKEFVFPMVTGKKAVFGLISFVALRDRAMRDALANDISDRLLFDRYREIIEYVASSEFDVGHAEEANGVTEVRVTSANF